MPSAIAPVSALLLSVAVLQVGVGLWNTLLPVRANVLIRRQEQYFENFGTPFGDSGTICL